MIVYPKSHPFGFTLEQEAMDYMAELLRQKVPFGAAAEQAIQFEKARLAEIVAGRAMISCARCEDKPAYENPSCHEPLCKECWEEAETANAQADQPGVAEPWPVL